MKTLSIVTSSTCPHCVNLRNKTGELKPDSIIDREGVIPHRRHLDWDFTFRVLTGNKQDKVQRWYMVNTHLGYGGTDLFFDEISTFLLEEHDGEPVIKQWIFKKNGNLTSRKSITYTRKKILPELSTKFHNIDVEWEKTIDVWSPPMNILKNYLQVFPSFLFYLDKGDDELSSWTEGALYAHVYGHETNNIPPYKIKRKPEVPKSILDHVDLYEEKPELLNRPDLPDPVLMAPIRTAFVTK